MIRSKSCIPIILSMFVHNDYITNLKQPVVTSCLSFCYKIMSNEHNGTNRTPFLEHSTYRHHISITIINFACDLVISRHRITHDFTARDPTCIAVPPIWLVLS